MLTPRYRLRVAVIGTRGLPATHGGVEHAVEALAREGARAGHDITVYGRRGYAQEDHGVPGVRQQLLPTLATKHGEAAVHTFLAVLHILWHRRRYDVVHVHATGPALIASVLRLFRIPMVATIHGMDYEREKWGRVARTVLHLAARVAATVPDRTIVVSDELRRNLLERWGRDAICIGNGVDADALQGESEPIAELGGQPFVLYLGRIVREKRLDLLLEAYAGLDTDCRLVIAGASGHGDDHADEIAALAAADPRIHMVGPRYGAEKNWLLQHARAVVLPSDVEGLPIVVLEALATGRPVLVSDIPQNLQAITIDGTRYGRSFAQGDARSLARELRALLMVGRTWPDPRSAVAERLDWAAFARQTEHVYVDVMRARGRQPLIAVPPAITV
ncbi:MAG: glycosyltransferase family 4 protein [Patulibacter minatonensis]